MNSELIWFMFRGSDPAGQSILSLFLYHNEYARFMHSKHLFINSDKIYQND